MGDTRTLTVKVVGDASSVESMFSKLGSSSTSLSSKLTGMASGLFVGGQVLSGLKTVAGGIWDVTNSAADLGEAVSKSEQIFGSAASQVAAFGDSAATAFGMSKTEAISAASQFGTLVKATGKAPGEVANMSTALVGLSGDLASFNNISSEVAQEKIFAGLTGQAEPLQALGVFLSADAVKAKGLAMGLADASGEMSESAKIQARYALIMEQTADAQGDYARTSESMPNLIRSFGAQFENLKTTLGEGLLPMFTSLLSKVVTVMPAITASVTGFVNTVSPPITAFASNLSGVTDFLSGFGGAVAEALNGGGASAMAPKWMHNLVNGFQNLRDMATVMVDTIQAKFQEKWPQIQEAVVPVLMRITEIFTNFTSLGLAIWEKFGGTIVDFVVGSFQAVMQYIGGVLKIINGIILVFKGLVTGNWSMLWEGVKSIVTGYLEMIAGVFRFFFWERFKLIFTIAFGILNALFGEKLNGIVAFFTALPGRIVGALGDVGSLLIDSGRKIMSGLWDGLKQKWEEVKAWFGKITDMIPNWKGPPSKDKKLLVKSGEMIMGGLETGMNSGARSMSPALLGGSGRGGGAPMTVNINVSNPDPMATVTALNDAVRMHGANVVRTG